MPVQPTLTLTFAKLQAWLKTHATGVSFRSPADSAAIDHFEMRSGLQVPDDLRQILLITDGETRTSAGAIGNWRLLPIAEIQAAWGWLTQLNIKGAFNGLTPNPSPYLQNAWWHPGWMPFVSNDSNAYFCIDTQPPEPSRFGQILLFFHDRPERPLIAASLEAWLDRAIRDLSTGMYNYDEVTGFDGEAFLWSALESKHLLDDIEGKRVV
jgi:cell wall assembly regulator SMI1